MNIKKFTKWMLLGGLGAGAAAYFADPVDGKRRRSAVAKGAGDLLEKIKEEGRKSFRDSQNHLAGMTARIRSSFTSEIPCDRVVEDRIRSRMGRVVAHPRKIHVLCDQGVITLWGSASKDEVPRLIDAVKATGGVTEVCDHLEIHETEEFPVSNEVKHARRDIRLNWSPSKRLLVGAAGSTLAMYGLKRKDVLGKAVALLGAGLVVRSTMTNHLRSTLAFGDEAPGYQLEKTIRINAPISDIYDFWANPENYPKAFSHVARIERLGENLFRWTIAGPAGVPVGWEGVITRSVPNTLVEWKSVPGSSIANFGIARFDPNYDASTRVHIRMFYRPPAGILGRFLAELFGSDPGSILDQDLKRLKQLFENGALPGNKRETGGEESELLKTATT